MGRAEAVVSVRSVLAVMFCLTGSSAALGAEYLLAYRSDGAEIGRTQLVQRRADATTVQGELDGLVVEGGGRLWWLKAKEQPLANVDCECHAAIPQGGDTSACKRTTSHTVIEAVDLVGAKRVLLSTELNGSSQEAKGRFSSGQVHHWSQRVLGQVRDTVFIAEYMDVYECGAAHGGQAATTMTLDLATGRIAPWPDAKAKQWLRPVIAKWAASSEGAAFRGGDEPVQIVSLRPRWSNGLLAFDFLVAVDDCFACSDGNWSSYTRSTWTASPVRPPEFAGTYNLPAALSRRIGEAPPTAAVGWSHVSEVRAAKVLELFGVGKKRPAPPRRASNRATQPL